MPAARRAIGIVRVSERKGREGESFASPILQADRIRAECERLELDLADPILDEVDVSGGLPLERRRGLWPAVQAIEAGEAGVLMVAYFDRLVRNIAVQQELVDRVEAAGGAVLTVDFGAVSHGSATQWLTASQMGLVHDYVRRVAKERSGEAQARAVARGVLPYPNVPPGYRRRADGVLEPDPAIAPAVLGGFEMRAAGATVAAVREHLAGYGVERSYHGVGALLKSRVVLGEIHFGALVNLQAHEPIVPRDLWQAVQRVSVSRGRRAKSDRLLARLGVLRCGSCGARMVVGTSNNSRYFIYRCPPNGGCSQRMTVSAELVEGIVVERVRDWLRDVDGRASAETNARDAATRLERAQDDLDAAVRSFAASGVQDEPSAVERLGELRQVRDDAQDHLDHLGGLRSAVTINAADDWDRLSLDARRALIRATVERVAIAPGRGVGRVTVELLGE